MSREKIAVVDTIAYQGLQPGKAYTVHGRLVFADGGKAVKDASGNAVEAGAEFVPASASGTAEVTFELDASKLRGGDKLVAFERVYDADGHLAASHEDLSDEGQTVTVADIGTTATDKADGDHVITKGKVTVVDRIAYSGLTTGTTYTVSGKLVDKETGKAVKDAKGKKVTASTTFTAPSSTGVAEVEFSFDASKLEGGSSLVAFERAYDAEGRLVAAHEDKDDKGQTVTVEKPGKPEMPTTPTTTKADTPDKGTPAVKTGDENMLVPAAMLLAAAACFAGALALIRRRYAGCGEKKEEQAVQE